MVDAVIRSVALPRMSRTEALARYGGANALEAKAQAEIGDILTMEHYDSYPLSDPDCEAKLCHALAEIRAQRVLWN